MSLQPAQFSPYISPARLSEVHEALGQASIHPPEARQHITRMVAGTRVPAKHLKGITDIVTNDPGVDEQGSDALYSPVLQSLDRPPRGELYLGQDIEAPVNTEGRDYKRHVIAHEIGHHQHHVDAPSDYLDAAYSGTTSPKRGRAEGMADNYAIANTAPRMTPEHPYEHTQETMGPKGAQAYNAHRSRGTLP